MKSVRRKRLGESLQQRGKISHQDLALVIKEQSRAAQTGHMVLSTMHTQDSISAMARLMDLNVTPFIASSTLSAVIAQRLIRRLCECRNEAAPSREYIRALEETGILAPPQQDIHSLGMCGLRQHPL
jgi:type II secretory ATPase GspE/PulE/Tfp pilus assembly ATPase PilB-like protein